MSATTSVIVGEVATAVMVGLVEYLKASKVDPKDINKLLDETVARVKVLDPNDLPDVGGD